LQTPVLRASLERMSADSETGAVVWLYPSPPAP
jgi:hypothetical protein